MNDADPSLSARLHPTPPAATDEPTHLRRATRLLLIALFVAAYVPFVINHGRGNLSYGHRDFPSFYYGAYAAFVAGESPYNTVLLTDLADQRVFPFLYPPPALLLFAPLTLMPFEIARGVFLAFNHGMVLAMLGLVLFGLLRLHPDRHAPAIAFAVVFVLAFHPLFIHLRHGQVNLLLGVLLVLAWLALRHERPAAAGACLALAVLVKTYPVLIVPLLVLRRRVQEAAWTVGFLAAATLVALAVLPGATWSDWYLNVLPAGGYGAFASASANQATTWPGGGTLDPAGIENASINGLVSRLLTANEYEDPLWVAPRLAKALTYAACLLVLLATAWTVWRSAAGRRAEPDVVMLLALPAMFLVAPLSWEHHLVYLLPVVIVLGVTLTRRVPFSGAAWAVWLGSAMLLAAPFLLRMKCLGVLGLWALAVVESRRRVAAAE